MGPQNGVMGDDNFGIDLPQSKVDNSQLEAETRMAQFSKSKEFKVVKDFMQSRIEYYQKFLPDGRELSEVNPNDMRYHWTIANAIIGEFNSLIAAFDQAETVVKEANQ